MPADLGRLLGKSALGVTRGIIESRSERGLDCPALGRVSGLTVLEGGSVPVPARGLRGKGSILESGRGVSGRLGGAAIPSPRAAGLFSGTPLAAGSVSNVVSPWSFAYEIKTQVGTPAGAATSVGVFVSPIGGRAWGMLGVSLLSGAG